MLMDVLEEVSEKHAATLRRLDRVINELSSNPSNVDLQEIVLHYLKSLRRIRAQLKSATKNALSEELPEELSETRFVVGTLSEYFLIVGLELEELLLRKLVEISSQGASIIARESERINKDLKEVSALKIVLQSMVEKYY